MAARLRLGIISYFNPLLLTGVATIYLVHGVAARKPVPLSVCKKMRNLETRVRT